MKARSGWLTVALLVLGAAPSARAATLQVANNGIDGPTCGLAGPCRSIGRAVANSMPNDTIVVGPGMYSNDLDQDGVFNEPGEEPFSGSGGIIIEKPLTIVSRFGASSTALRTPTIGFLVAASNVTIGKRNGGFTISSIGNSIGVAANFELHDVRIAGNVIAVDGPGGPAGIITLRTRHGRIEHNRIVAPRGCSVGMELRDSGDLIAHNVVEGCSKGFNVQDAVGARVVRNTAIGNVDLAANKQGIGFQLFGNIAEFTGNAAIGNGTGVYVLSPVSVFHGNSFYGNTTQCGVANFGGVPVDATSNYWGAATGPGPDPADVACDVGAAPTIVTSPFLGSDPTQAQAAIR